MQFSDIGPFTKPIIFFFSYQIEKQKSKQLIEYEDYEQNKGPRNEGLCVSGIRLLAQEALQ